MYYLMYYSSNHSLWRNPRQIYKPVVKSTISKYFQFEKNSTDSAGDQEKWNYHDSRFGGDPEKSCSLCQDLRNFKYSLRTQFLDLELDWGLYIQCQDTARPTRTFLVAITASRTLCGGTFTSRSIIDMCSLARYLEPSYHRKCDFFGPNSTCRQHDWSRRSLGTRNEPPND